MMTSTNFLCAASLLLSIYTNIISARTLTTQTPGDVTTSDNQSDEGLVLTRMDDVISILEDVDYSTNTTFNTLCTVFCDTYHSSSTCCHDIRLAAKSFSDLSSLSSNTETPGAELVRDDSAVRSRRTVHTYIRDEIQTICSVTSKYLLQVQQMVVETQRRACVGSVCPLSSASCETQRTRDTKYCLLRLLSTRIYSFQLILQQMIVSNGLSVPTTATPESHDVITDPTIQDQRDLYILSNAHDTWIQMLKVLRRILGN